MVLNKSSCCLSACGIDFALEGRLAEATNCRQILLRDLLLILLLKDLLLLVFIILALGCSGLPRKTRFAVYLQKICASKDSVSRLYQAFGWAPGMSTPLSISSVVCHVVHYHMLAEHSIQGVLRSIESTDRQVFIIMVFL